MDVAGYHLMKNIFLASITGNVIKGASITAKSDTVTCLVIVTIAYGLGSAIIRVFATGMKSRKDFNYLTFGVYLLSVEFMLLIISMLVGSYLYPLIEASDDINSWPIIITGTIIAITMGAQVGNAPVAFAQFPNTTGMTASVAATCAAIANLCMVYAAKEGFINFYLTNAEEESLHLTDDKATVDKERDKLLLSKIGAAWDECGRQAWPLIGFTLGAATGAIAAEHIHFWSLFVPQIIVLFLLIEIVWQRSEERSKIKERQSSSDPGSESGYVQAVAGQDEVNFSHVNELYSHDNAFSHENVDHFELLYDI